MAEWSFLTNHARALVCIARDPGVRLREIAAVLGVTERRAFGIVTDLTKAGYVVKQKDGRRNRYRVKTICRCEDSSTDSQRSVSCWECSWTPAQQNPRDGHTRTAGRAHKPEPLLHGRQDRPGRGDRPTRAHVPGRNSASCPGGSWACTEARVTHTIILYAFLG